jgi:hypothetical protein
MAKRLRDADDVDRGFGCENCCGLHGFRQGRDCARAHFFAPTHPLCEMSTIAAGSAKDIAI